MEANREFYSSNAESYAATETCVTSPRLQAMLREDLNEIVQMISGRERGQISALDACGGSGNAALKLLRYGVNVTVCDISPELLQIFESRCEGTRASYRVVQEEIGSFLSNTSQRFHLIVFSSALHHIEDHVSILRLAATLLNDDGYIYTVFDPPTWEFPAWQIIWLDYLLFKCLNQAEDILPAVFRFLRRGERRINAESYHFEDSNRSRSALEGLVECYLRSGIDDFSLAQTMMDGGLKLIWHRRYSEARNLPFRKILSVIKRPTSFKLLFQK